MLTMPPPACMRRAAARHDHQADPRFKSIMKVKSSGVLSATLPPRKPPVALTTQRGTPKRSIRSHKSSTANREVRSAVSPETTPGYRDWSCDTPDRERATAITRSPRAAKARSEEHTSELQSQSNLVCRLLLEKKKQQNTHTAHSHT